MPGLLLSGMVLNFRKNQMRHKAPNKALNSDGARSLRLALRVCRVWHRACEVRLRLSSIRSELMAEGSRSQVLEPGISGAEG
jgi:hypothetical protein